MADVVSVPVDGLNQEHLERLALAALASTAGDPTAPARDRVAAAREIREWVRGDAGGPGLGRGIGPETDPGSLTLEDVDALLAGT